METNDSDMSLSEWQIVSSEEDKEDPKEKDSEESMVMYNSKDADEAEEDVPKGSSVEDVLEEQEEPPHCESSCSSSDIDIIDESALDYSQSNISMSSLELSLSTSLDKSLSAPLPALPVRELTPEPRPVNDIALRQEWFPRNQFLIVLALGCIATFMMHIPEPPNGTFEQMEIRILTLQEENKNLRSRVDSKIEDGKLFVSLEGQIKALKAENSKLSSFMKDLIHQLEEKRITFKKESEIKGAEAYQNEVNKLKEQVNILQIDNEELQNQLVRMRYGRYSPRAEDPPKPDDVPQTESSDDGKESDNSTEVLSEEIKDLRQKLHSEVEKLKNWKESVQVLMKELENRPKEQESGDKSKVHKKNKESRPEGNFKDSHGDAKEKLKQIPNFNITDLVFQYIGVDKKKVKDVFESVGHYFKKAQSKTKEIFDENVKNDMMNFIGEFRKQWHMMKKAYFPKHGKKNQAADANSHKPHFTEKDSEKKDSSFTDGNDHKPHFTERYQEKRDSSFQTERGDKSRQHTEQEKERKMSRDSRHFDKKDEFKRESTARVQENSKGQTYKQNMENLAETTASLDSWLFERATHRSELRDEKKGINWYLKNRKEVDSFEYDNLDQDEPTGDPYENIDLFAMD